MSYAEEVAALKAEADALHRRTRLERNVAIATLLVLGGALVVIALGGDRTVYTTGPCSVLGLATHPELPGPVVVVDCDGVQVGVPALRP